MLLRTAEGVFYQQFKHCCQMVYEYVQLSTLLERRIGKGKGKAISLQALRGPEGSRRLRLPDFKSIGT
jgi:hypothetical protein